MTDRTERRLTITITPVTEDDLQAFIDAWRDRFGRKHLIHVIGNQPAGTHVDDAPTESIPPTTAHEAAGVPGWLPGGAR